MLRHPGLQEVQALEVLESRAVALGERVADILTGSWRAVPPPIEVSPDDVAAVAPVLLATGAGGLGWWRLSHAGAGEGPDAAGALHDAFRFQVLDARLREQGLARVTELLGAADIDFVVAKGWAIGRLYAHAGLRPYGDFDVFVAPDDHARAVAVLRSHPEETARVDLHAGVPLLGRPWRALREGADETDVAGVPIRLLGAVDHLVLSCVHLFFHGAWRPPWLTDVAAFVEALPDGFDWTKLEAVPSRQREQCRGCVLLARRLLGADVDRTPWSGSGERLPPWLPTAVLRAWGRGGHYSVTTRIGMTGPKLSELLHAVRVRWPNPVEATYRWRAPLNAFPRFPFQLLDTLARGVRLFSRP